jgi:hypothetical protein
VSFRDEPHKLDFLPRIQRPIPDSPLWFANPDDSPCLLVLIIVHWIGLESRIESAASTQPTVTPETLQTFAADLAKIRKSLVDATGSLPAYDQRQCQLVRVAFGDTSGLYLELIPTCLAIGCSGKTTG